VTGTGPEAASVAAPAVVVLCHEYAALAGVAVAGVAEFLADAAALAVRLLPTAQSARIRVRVPEVVTAIADAPDADHPGRAGQSEVLAIPLVGGGDLAGVLELDPGARDGFPADERELAEVLAVLLTLTLSLGHAA
jgi:GAF domain